jgi:hypothetical protein
MLVGHGALAFLIVGTVVNAFTDRPPRQCLRLAFVAFLFGTLPDVDALFSLAITAAIGVSPGSVVDFWEIVNTFHRSTTHAFFVQFAAGLVATGVASLAPSRRWTTSVLGLAVVATSTLSTVWIVTVFGSVQEGLLVTVFLALAAILAYAAVALTALTDRLVGVAALVGLLSHSPGDLFWIPPPDLLYPFVSPTLTGPLQLHPAPEINVGLVFLGESVVLALGVLTYFHVVSVSPVERLHVAALSGVLILAFRPVVLLPTIEHPYTYSAALLGLALFAASVSFLRGPAGTRLESAALNGVCSLVVASIVHVLALVL